MTRILLVEDERSLREPLAFLLEREGYRVTMAKDGPGALEAFDHDNPDLILLDLMLPGLSGTEVCRQIRTHSNVPIIMLTAKDSEVDIVVGLELGADDYVTKPYSSRELLARMRAVLRRKGDATAANEDILTAGDVTMDVERHTLTVRGQPVTLPLKEYELLELFMRNPRRVLTREMIFDRVWGYDFGGESNIIEVYVRYLRQKTEENGEPRLVHTVRGVGYVLRED